MPSWLALRLARLLLRLHRWCYEKIGPLAVAAEGGLHPKHRLTRYHRFFVDNVAAGESVLDIGCGNGALLKDIAAKTKAPAVGIELSEENAAAARQALAGAAGVRVVCGDATEYSAERPFDAVVLSNVLEHLDGRAAFLRRLRERHPRAKFLIRVPQWDRQWLVPYMEEQGLDSRLDPTHRLEYTEEKLDAELREAGLEPVRKEFRWGEIYVVARGSGPS
jgi:SAM-dependent methyltransferase